MSTSSRFNSDELRAELLRLCPPTADGHRSVAVLAGHLGLSCYAIYKWINAGKVPPRRTRDLVKFQARHFGEVRVPAHKLNPLFL